MSKIIGPCLNWDGPGYAPCPICEGKVIGRARNFRADSVCKNGHSFHTCMQHKVYVRGQSDCSNGSLSCTCGKNGEQMSLLEDIENRAKEPIADEKPYSTEPIYAVYTTTTEWGKKGELVCHTTSKRVAEFMADGAGWWGGKGMIIEQTALVIGGEIFVLDDSDPITVEDMSALNQIATDKMKEKALAKLSPNERKALGVNQS